ncbi:hypothetical protein EV426DRAFT_641143 [Tirmania nivea]|nr:hypothetical protein EV426DRAFT_641143 [Tirmania nivea]
MPTTTAFTFRTPLLSSPWGKDFRYNGEKGCRSSPNAPDKKNNNNEPLVRCSFIFFAVLAVVFSVTGVMTLCGVGPGARAPVTAVRRRIAIIGAGASGVSAAYHLAKIGPRGTYRDSLEITVFEKSPIVGGRCLAIDVPQASNSGSSVLKVELGSPGYNSELDPLISSLVQVVGLQAQVVPGGRWAKVEADYDLGIYNGRNFLFRQPHNPSGLWYWWTSLIYFLRYGWAHKDLECITKKLAPMWDNFAQALSFPSSWSQNSDSLLESPELRSAITSAANSFLESKNIKHPFTTEQVQSRTRARYGANLGVLSGMQALRVMDEARNEKVANVNIQGGMAQLFTRMLLRRITTRNTKINLKLGTMVAGIRKNRTDEGETPGWTVAHFPVSGGDNTEPELTMEEFDDVVVAAPWQFTGMNIQPEYKLPTVSWEKVHVTVFTSPNMLAPGAFGLGKDDHRGMPQRVLSTLADSERDSLNGKSGEEGVGESGWWSIERVGTVPRLSSVPLGSESCGDPVSPSCMDSLQSIRTENVFRILSPSAIANETILKYLGTSEHNDSLTWIHRQFWEHAFQTPLPSDQNEEYPPIKVDDGLWYTGSMEGVWGGVEAAISMGKRAAGEISHNWYGKMPLRGTVMRGTQW